MQEEELAIPTVTGAGKTEGTLPSVGGIQQNFAASSANELIRNSLRLWIRQSQRLGSSLRNSQESVLPKSKRVVFISPEILRLSEKSILTQWNDFRLLATNFLGNNKADIDNLPVENLLLSYQKFGCPVSFKIL
jgi:hypothetical protein